jgi:beta-aspartyl-peptidase (threonine type)
MRPSIIVHGGAGTWEDERCIAGRLGCERAAEAGWAVLGRGGSALDAVEAAVRALEDDPEFNAGLGAALTREGTVEVDACIMDGALRVGAVGAVPSFRHPVTLARRILEDGEHALLVGAGALAFGAEHGLFADPPGSLISARARARLMAERARPRGAAPRPGDTVGACAVDSRGLLAAATSTGGISHKRPGRVGDSPLPGAGAFADADAGAASTTGHGESILRVGMARTVVEHLRAGAGPDEAAAAGVAEVGARTGGAAGVIVVAADGRVGHAKNTPRMPWAAVVGGAAQSGIDA